MDQTNPLSEITHKRRLSALGPGGLSRERAGFEVRDVHPTHYGRICPIETPEGPNIGLISSLSCFARINEFGFIESPYRKVKGGRMIDYAQIVNAGDSEFKAGEIIERDRVEAAQRRAQAPQGHLSSRTASTCRLGKKTATWSRRPTSRSMRSGRITTELVNCRQAGNFVLKQREEVDYVDVSPKQLVSVAASLIPFLENDDANRALMGSNMQRQAVPLIRGEAPLVGTGMERVTARDSGAVVICSRDGIVDQVDSERIIVRVESRPLRRTQPRSWRRHLHADQVQAFQPEHLHQPEAAGSRRRPREHRDRCWPTVLAPIAANWRSAATCWSLSCHGADTTLKTPSWSAKSWSRRTTTPRFTSRSMKSKRATPSLVPEEITRDIPNISEIVPAQSGRERRHSHRRRCVKPGDILVGKVTPKGETTLTPEEKLLRAIFGEKAGDVRDASLYCPPGIEGTVVDVKIFSRKGAEKDERHKAIEASQVFSLERTWPTKSASSPTSA